VTDCLPEEHNFWAGLKFASLEDPQAQDDRWRETICNVRIHASLDERPIDRFGLEHAPFFGHHHVITHPEHQERP
jgi:hypothetical protein